MHRVRNVHGEIAIGVSHALRIHAISRNGATREDVIYQEHWIGNINAMIAVGVTALTLALAEGKIGAFGHRIDRLSRGILVQRTCGHVDTVIPPSNRLLRVVLAIPETKLRSGYHCVVVQVADECATVVIDVDNHRAVVSQDKRYVTIANAAAISFGLTNKSFTSVPIA